MARHGAEKAKGGWLGKAAALCCAFLAAPAALLAESEEGSALLQSGLFDTDRAAITAVDLSYEVYGGGFHVLSLATQAIVTPRRYEIVSRLETRGIADTLFNGQMDSQAHGLMTPAGPELLTYAQDYAGYFGERSVDIARTADGSYEVTAEPPDGIHADGSLPAHTLRGTIDPLTASVFTAINDTDAPCAQVVPVFDGRRVFRLRFRPDGEEILQPESENAYAGPALRCKVTYEAVAGFSRDWYIDQAKDPLKPFTIWLASFESADKKEGAPDRFNVPVRLLIETRYLNGVAHLSRAIIDGEERIALNASAQP
ncbi:DUF3108 domain-containing protein [Tepidicaulis sp. LMO-SS28]|uniref:DUF3108 domain-containing protein n=1 Tax=Tepidicaulis sp. LMO-SS28 TaxID=3447455 RepID=UPI003EE2C522